MPLSATADGNTRLPGHFVPGHVLSSNDVELLRGMLTEREISPAHRPLTLVRQRIVSGLEKLTKFTGRITVPLARFCDGATSATGFLLVAFVLCLPLVWNIGYFSHDELQWLSFADKPSLSDMPWNGWFYFNLFQYRPLTFNLWLLLSHFFGYQPILMHLVRVIFALTTAWLLRSVLLQFEVTPRHAALTCWIWLLTPYAVYTHGWVGTYADSLCLIFMLMALRFVLQQPAGSWWQSASSALPIAALTALALLSKESAVIFPVVFLIAAFRRRDKIVAAAFAASTVIVLVYLSLRLRTILFPHVVSSAYHWSLTNIPARLTEYSVFPFMTGHFEVIASRDYLTGASLLCLAILAAALASTGWHRFTVFWLGWIVMLGPVLILAQSANHYAFLAGAFACAFVGCSWTRCRRLAKFGFALIAAVTVVHGIQVAREMRNIGRIQNHLYADLMPSLAHDTAPIGVQAQRNKEDFILRRLLNDVPSYRHEPIMGRVSVIAFADKADKPDYLMRGDGHLIPAR